MSTPRRADLYERRKYRRPPIVEAICEFRLAAGTDEWNPAMPGLLYERVRDQYPETPQQQFAAGAEIQVQQNLPGLSLRQPVPAVELSDANGRNVITTGPDVLTVRVREPYPGWEAFHERIHLAATHLSEVASGARVQRIGLRYVNRVVIPDDRVELEAYFNAAPHTPDEFPEDLIGIFARFESRYADDENRDIRLLYTFASTPHEGEGSAFLLDIDVIEIWGDSPISLSEVAVLTDLKRRETDAFEAIVTDRARELFDAD